MIISLQNPYMILSKISVHHKIQFQEISIIMVMYTLATVIIILHILAFTGILEC